METIYSEKIDEDALSKLISHFDDLKHHFEKSNEEKGEKRKYDMDTLKSILIKYQKSKRKSNDIKYGFSGKLKEGRMFSKGCSLQSLGKIIRHTIAGDLYHDVDMKNAHPCILSQYCKKNDIKCDTLDEYINNRDGVINSLIDEYQTVSYNDMKKLILTIINGGGKNELDSMNDWLLKFYNEMTTVRDEVCKKNPNLVKRARNRKKYNINGSATNYLMCNIENEILQSIVRYCDKTKVKVGALVFDGLMIYKESFESELSQGLEYFLVKASEFVKQDVNWDIVLVEKPMDSGLDLSEYDLMESDDEEEIIEFDDKYVLTSEEQEKYVWTDFYTETRGIRQSKSDLFNLFKTRFPYVCSRLNIGKGLWVKKETIDNKANLVKGDWLEWYSCYNSKGCIEPFKQREILEAVGLKTYSSLCYKPNLDDVAPHQYNTWSKLQADKEIIIETDVNPLLDFIKEIICNKNDDLYKYIITWLRRICKTPWNKTQTVLLFHSKQGTGKGSFVNWLITHVFGKFNSTYSSIDKITQRFNTVLSNKVFIACDELPSVEKQFHKLFDDLKSIITDPYVSIEPKGLEPYMIDNLCNFIFMTNNKHSIKLEQSDRRYAVFSINESKIGDYTYWDYIHNNVFTEIMADNFFKYLIEISDDNELIVDLRKIPDTKLRQEMKEMSMTNIECFIKDVRERNGIDGLTFVLYGAKVVNKDCYGNDVLESTDICIHEDYKDGQEFFITKKELYEVYEKWCDNNGEKPSKLKFFNSHLEEVRMGKERMRCFRI
jgi:hypothetical protein